MGSNNRTFILRQAGLSEIRRDSRGAAECAIALIDGLVDVSHPAFEGILLIGAAA
jgi:hypothetical protein